MAIAAEEQTDACQITCSPAARDHGATPFMKEDELIVFGEDIVVEIERIDADMAAPVVTGQMAGGLRPTSY